MSYEMPTYSTPDFVNYLTRRKETISRLCAALTEYLYDNIDDAITAAQEPQPRPPRPTIEDLNKAQEQLDLAQAQLEAIQNMCANVPQHLAEILRVTQMPQIEHWINEMQERVSYIQKAMEEPEPDPSNPWDGSHRLGVLCTICAKDSGITESSPLALKASVKAAGWGRDADGDHICPACVAASTNPISEPAALSDIPPATETGAQTPKETA